MYNFLDSHSDKLLSASSRRNSQTKFRNNLSTCSKVVEELIHKKDPEIKEDNKGGQCIHIILAK